jgi:hypothetical protein
LSIEPRLASHVQVSAFIRLANASGDFATVIRKGDRISGAILLISMVRGVNRMIYERFPSIDGSSSWQPSLREGDPTPQQVSEFVEKRSQRDPDLWVIELDTADDERLAGLLTSGG